MKKSSEDITSEDTPSIRFPNVVLPEPSYGRPLNKIKSPV